MILVIGASGYMGRETAKQLLAAGIPVRATSRSPETITDLTNLGAEVCQADLIDPDSLKRACQGVDGVVSAAHSLIGSGKYLSKYVDGAGQFALIDAAKAAGVKHFVFASIMGASPTAPVQFIRRKYAAEQYLMNSGLHFTILRPSAFMEWHAHNFLGKPLLETGKTTILGKGENPANFIAAADVAKFAVIGLTDPRACDQMLNIGGMDNISRIEVARMYAQAAGIKPKISHMPRAMLRVMGAVLGVIKPEIGDLMRTAYWTDTSDQTFNPKDLLVEFPVELTRLEAFIKQKVAEYKASR